MATRRADTWRSVGQVGGFMVALASGAVLLAGAAWADDGDATEPRTRSASAQIAHNAPRAAAAVAMRHGPSAARIPRSTGVTAKSAPRSPSRTLPAATPRAPIPTLSNPVSAPVNLPSYWPMFTGTEKRRFDYTSPDGSLAPITAIFRYDRRTDSMLYEEYDASMAWQDTWYYQARPGYGIAEWRDDYPQSNPLLKLFFGPVQKTVLATPIGWGENLPVGGVYQNDPRLSFCRSWLPRIGFGWQYVQLEAVLDEFTTRDGTTYRDVIQFVYQQKWGDDPQAGARYWMAKGVGPVAIQWIAEDPQTHLPVESVRIDAVVSTTY